MKKLIRFIFFSLILFSISSSLNAQQNIDFTLKFNYDSSQFEVYANPDFSGLYYLGGGSQISIVLPGSIANSQLNVISVEGGPWSDNSQVYDFTSGSSNDFHGIATTGTSTMFMAAEEKLLFKFELPGKVCGNDVRLFENTLDPDASVPGMSGGDYFNFFADVFNPSTNDYRSNYDNSGWVCADPPLAVDDSVSVEMIDSIVVYVQNNDTNPNGNGLITEIIEQGTGTATVLNGDSLVYTPSPGFFGNDTITYRICDDVNTGLCDTAIVVVTVTIPVLPPVTNRCNVFTGEDVVLNLAGNNVDPGFKTKIVLTDETGAIAYTADALPIADVAAGNYFAFSFNYDTTRTNVPNFSVGVNIYGTGGDCFDISEPLPYGVCDCNLQESTVMFTAAGQNADADHRQLYLLTDGRDSILDTSSVAQFDDLEELIYNVYALNYKIADSVENYVAGNYVSDITGDCFDLSDPLGYAVCNLNEPPVVLPVPLVTKEDSTGTICMEILDAPSDTFNVTSCGAGHGTESWTLTGSELCLEYTPDPGYSGNDTVCVIVCDQAGACDTTYVPVVVVPAPAPETTPVSPTVIPTVVVLPLDSTMTVCTPILDSNAGDTHTATNCPGVTTNGTVTPTVSDGMLCVEYVSDGVFVGTENVCIIVCDDASPALCDTVEIPVTVIPLPGPADSLQAPIAVVPPIVTPEDSTITTCGVIVDPNALDTHSATICQQPSNGSATVSVDDALNQVCITLDPDNDFIGTDSLCLSVCDSTGLCDTINVPIEVLPSVSELKLRVYLQGAFLTSGNNPQLGITDTLMRDDLRSQGLIPLVQPYSEANYNARFTQTLGGGEETTSGVFALPVDTSKSVVDWVFIEMRDKDDATAVVRTYSGLVQRNGDVVSHTGGDLMFNNLPDSFYVSIKHRNHLGAMTANPVGLVNGSTLVDFTKMSDADLYSETGYDGLEMVTIGNVKALWTGNANQDNKTKYDGGQNDQVIIMSEVLSFPQNTGLLLNYSNAVGYFLGDINMDGKTKFDGDGNDRIIIQGISLTYPLNTTYANNYDLLKEQIPD